jgi:hypothetical protein
MRIQTLADVSDLHLGGGARSTEMARVIADTLLATKVVVARGRVTCVPDLPIAPGSRVTGD